MYTIIDTTGHFTTGQGYGVTAIAKYRDSVLRAAVKVDAYERQSSAYVSRMDDHGDWVHLLEAPASKWHGDAPSYTNKANPTAASLFTSQLVDTLLVRAMMVVDAIEG